MAGERLLAQPTVMNGQHSGCDPFGSGVVSHHQQRCSGPFGMLAEEVVDLVGARRVELASRFIGDDRIRDRERARGECDTLTFTARERGRAAVGQVAEPETIQCGGCGPPTLVATKPQDGTARRHCRGSRDRR